MFVMNSLLLSGKLQGRPETTSQSRSDTQAAVVHAMTGLLEIVRTPTLRCNDDDGLFILAILKIRSVTLLLVSDDSYYSAATCSDVHSFPMFEHYFRLGLISKYV